MPDGPVRIFPRFNGQRNLDVALLVTDVRPVGDRVVDVIGGDWTVEGIAQALVWVTPQHETRFEKEDKRESDLTLCCRYRAKPEYPKLAMKRIV